MSFLKLGNKTVQYGDTVVVYLNPSTMYVQQVEPGKVFQTKFGAMKHDDVIDKLYGSKIQCTRGYVYVLKATPEFWTLCLPHRTQIMYFTDIAYITTSLDLKPGSIVVEAGTGSGSMTHSMARTVAPFGHVYTFDFHESRSIEAKQEFEQHGLSSVVTAAHRDVCEKGFPDELDNKVHAIFLDLPHPWECIPKVNKTLLKGGRICCFSPCIEQVQKTCQALSQNYFIDVSTYECLARQYDVRKTDMCELDFSSTVTEEENGAEGMECAETEPGDESLAKDEGNKNSRKSFISTCPFKKEAGHTGFLSFATKFS